MRVESVTVTTLIPDAVHSEVPHDKPGLCPDCLNRWIDGRGGGKVQLVERDGKWVCPKSGPSLAKQLGSDGIRMLGAGLALPTISLNVGVGWWLTNVFHRWWQRK